MNLLLDENLSPRLTIRLASLFPGLTHVRYVGLKQAIDQDIWIWAMRNEHTIVTADSDFLALQQRLGSPPKVIHVERCDMPLLAVEDLFRQNAIRISEFQNDPSINVLIMRSPLLKNYR